MHRWRPYRQSGSSHDTLCEVVHNDRVLGAIMTLTVNSIGNQMVGRDLLAENGGQLLGVLLFVRACFLTILAR